MRIGTDPGVRDVLTADLLHGQLLAVIARCRQDGLAGRREGWDSAIAEVDRLYAAMWEALDQAAEATRLAGRDTVAFMAARDRVDRRAGVREIHALDGTIAPQLVEAHFNDQGLAAGARASEALKAAWPDVD